MVSDVSLVSAVVAGLTALCFVKKYFNGGTCTNTVRLDGKTVIITGSNTGIGKETALELARRGATVVMACRDIAKAKRAAEEIRGLLGFKCNILVRHLDLSSLDSVRKFAKEMNEELDAIHILINNAGASITSYTETAEGFEMTMGANHLGPFLLTCLLLDKIKKSVPSRIVNVASTGYRKAKLDMDNIFGKRDEYHAFTFYRNSKLANILFTKELAQRLRGSGVVTYCLHPGLVRSDMFSQFVARGSFISRIFVFLLSPLVWLISKSVRHGAQTSIYCATEPQLDDEKWSGCYFADCAVQKLLPHAEDMDAAKRLWAVSEKFTMK